MENQIFSLGIDIGTTTTQVIFSKFTVKNINSAFFIPKVEVTDKIILHKSQIYFTPLTLENNIDFDAVTKIVRAEFEKAGIKKESISTGAIIVTGETARKDNAELIAHELSDILGDFVVALAGPDLEAVLAGFGAGTYEISKSMKERIINFDVGGGTTNACLFNSGKREDCFALDIGGRLIKFNEYGEVTYISNKIKFMIENFRLNIRVGKTAKFIEIKKLTDKMAEMFVELSGFTQLSENTNKLFIGHKNSGAKVNYITFSGGVSEYIYGNEEICSMEAAIKFGDIGPLLGYSIRKTFDKYKDKIITPRERIRATVIGAGNHSIKISGSTVIFDEEVLPMKNVPIVKVLDDSFEGKDIERIKKDISVYQGRTVALAYEGPKNPSYMQIKNMADGIIKVFEGLEQETIIVVVQNDFAKALGQTIKNKLGNSRRIVCIDEISTSSGDYIDLGKPVAGIIPVVVKTLIFKF
ncbi:ethanolamine ammonia-lyase reactivating factor EutA [Clostridium neuense]|uniref:Ethanolamine ammonia-lyase reactivating factor EutA n=1 Tax=Clostridium neuense TaxID=1728934 RepID=A0ABW8TKG5_9CLOT